MKLLPLAGLLVLSIATLPLSGAVDAAGVQRCEAPDGSVVYTDRTCGLFGNMPTPLSAEVLARIAREASTEASMTGKLVDDTDKRFTIVARRSVQSGCARSPTQLAMDIQGSMALRDVNRLAESYHWADQSHRQAHQLMHRLDGLIAQPLLDASFYGSQIGPGPIQFAGSGAISNAMGVMQLSFEDTPNTRVMNFEVLRFSGCYFIRF